MRYDFLLLIHLFTSNCLWSFLLHHTWTNRLIISLLWWRQSSHRSSSIISRTVGSFTSFCLSQNSFIIRLKLQRLSLRISYLWICYHSSTSSHRIEMSEWFCMKVLFSHQCSFSCSLQRTLNKVCIAYQAWWLWFGC